MEDRDGHPAAGIGGGGRIEGPGAAAFDDLVAHASDGRRSVIFHCHLLTALGGVAAGVGGLPGAGHVEGAAAMTGGVGYGVEDRDRSEERRVGGGGRIEGPGAAAFG